MCDPVTGFIMAAASSAVSVASGFAQASAAKRAASAQAEAENQRLQQVYTENRRQQEENNRIAVEKTSDRVREANREIGTLRAAVGEMGANITPFVVAAGYNEGIDKGRIEKNRSETEAAIDQSSRMAEITAASNIRAAYDDAATSRRTALFNALGSGLSLASTGMKTFGRKPLPTHTNPLRESAQGRRGL